MPEQGQDWAKEPWSVSHWKNGDWDAVLDANGEKINEPPGWEWEDHAWFSEEDLERAVACVNACRGISQEAMKRIADGRGFSDIISGLLQQKYPDHDGEWTWQFEDTPPC